MISSRSVRVIYREEEEEGSRHSSVPRLVLQMLLRRLPPRGSCANAGIVGAQAADVQLLADMKVSLEKKHNVRIEAGDTNSDKVTLNQFDILHEQLTACGPLDFPHDNLALRHLGLPLRRRPTLRATASSARSTIAIAAHL